MKLTARSFFIGRCDIFRYFTIERSRDVLDYARSIGITIFTFSQEISEKDALSNTSELSMYRIYVYVQKHLNTCCKSHGAIADHCN